MSLMTDLVLAALSSLVPGGVRLSALRRDDRVVRWAESGSGGPAVVLDAALGEPGTLAWAGVMPLVAPRARVLAYDRAGLGASDPVTPLTLQAQVDGLLAVIHEAGGRCVVAGHSWGALLGQLAALRHPELIAGLVLVDPAEEEFLAAMPDEARRQEIASGDEFVEQYESGKLPDTIREIVGSFARRLTGDRQAQALILDAYVSSYAKQSQVAAIAGEKRLVFESLPAIRQARAGATLPAVPVVVFSATTGRAPGERHEWTRLQARVAASVPGGEHVVLPDTSHAVNQERPAEIAQAINHIIDAARG